MINERIQIKTQKKGKTKMKKNIKEYRVYNCDYNRFEDKVFSDRLSAERFARILRDSAPVGYSPCLYMIAEIKMDLNY